MKQSRRWRVRWSILGCLFGFSIFGYMQRTGIAIAAEPMMRELGLDQVVLGWLITVFLTGYTVFQIPGAMLGEYGGPRRALTWMGVTTLLATAVTALTPRLASVTAAIAILIAARLVLGAAQGGLYPVATGAIKNWFPVRNWGFAQGFLVTGAWVGSAITPPLLSALLLHLGWRAALAAVCIPSLLLLIWWQIDARDRPAEHRRVTEVELAELAGDATTCDEKLSLSRLAHVLVDPQVLLVTVSYFLMNYVFYLVTFWSFLYLRQERQMTLLESGWMASLPFLAAAIATAAGGRMSDYLIGRWGAGWGVRILPLISLPSAGLFLWLTGIAPTAWFAVAALCLAFGFCELMEGPYWSVTMRLAPDDSMAATAVLNTGGNLGGVVATPAIAALSANHQWHAIFALGAATSVAAAVLWFWVNIAGARAEAREVCT
ncbi:MAG TPA: MFS transporter [Steroidobacteraceae bacterium]|nr:MFS transporter [Steroidobacteraceae bacterium]